MLARIIKAKNAAPAWIGRRILGSSERQRACRLLAGMFLTFSSFLENGLAQTNNPSNSKAAGAEQGLLAGLPQLLVKRDVLAKAGWAKPGQDLGKQTVYFKRTGYQLSDIRGEAGFLYDGQSLVEFSFYTDGSDLDSDKLYKFLAKTLNHPGDRKVKGEGWSEINWQVVGKSIRYDITLIHHKWENDLERGVSIILHPVVPSEEAQKRKKLR